MYQLFWIAASRCKNTDVIWYGPEGYNYNYNASKLTTEKLQYIRNDDNESIGPPKSGRTKVQ